MKGGKRTLSKPLKKKEPISSDIFEKVIDLFGGEEKIRDLRSVGKIAMLGFVSYKRGINFGPYFSQVRILTPKLSRAYFAFHKAA